MELKTTVIPILSLTSGSLPESNPGVNFIRNDARRLQRFLIFLATVHSLLAFNQVLPANRYVLEEEKFSLKKYP